MKIFILGSELGGGFLCNSILAPDCWLMLLMVSPPRKKKKRINYHYVHSLSIMSKLHIPLKGKANQQLTFANNEAGLHGRHSESEFLQASRRAHVPVSLSTAPPSAPVTRGASSLHTPQQVRYDICCVLCPVWRPNNLSDPLWCGAIIWSKRTSMCQRLVF